MAEFTIRRMTMDDKPAMMEISSRIWEGDDYLPLVFDAWVADREGEFAAVLLRGKLIGCGKLTFLTPVDAWFEGLRKDPLVKEKGVGEAVARHFLSLIAGRPGLASVRFTTYVRNLRSIGANERVGFRLRTALSFKSREGKREELLSAPGGSGTPSTLAVQVISDEEAVLAFLRRSGYFSAMESLIVEGWKAWPWSPEFLAERYVRPGCCRGIMTDRGLRALSISTVAHDPARTAVRLVCLDALDGESGGAMLDDLVRTTREAVAASSAAKWEIEWTIPRVSRLHEWADKGEFRSWEQEDDMLVYEMPLDMLPLLARKPREVRP